MTDAQGIPLAAFTDSASVAEVHLLEPTLASIPPSIRLPERMPLIADRAYDSDPLRATLAERGIDLIAPHRKNRTAAPTNDGRKMRRYQRRWKVERTFAWLHSYRCVRSPASNGPSNASTDSSPSPAPSSHSINCCEIVSTVKPRSKTS